jgi:hypothetical protein
MSPSFIETKGHMTDFLVIAVNVKNRKRPMQARRRKGEISQRSENDGLSKP